MEMPETYALQYKNCLTPDARRALWNATIVLIDELFSDVATLEHDAIMNDGDIDPSATLAFSWLPKRAHHRMTLVACKGYLAVVICVTARLADGVDVEPRCAAEELALHHLIDEAKAQEEMDCEEAGTEARHSDYSAWEDVVLQDTDVLLLFDDWADGIEDYGNESLGIGPKDLDVSSWFKQFGNVPLPHPYVAAADDD